jgi:CheY-like chemotaxis protein
MPRSSGAQFMAELSKDAAFSAIPVVLLTADVRAAEKSKSWSFAGYLEKPVDLDVLFEIVARYSGRDPARSPP